jgi:predicted esterase YcpF (UPF0227 family)
MILYLHGFRSSPRSFKASLLAQAMQDRGLADAWLCPQLPPSPAQSLALADRLIRKALPGGPDQARAELVVIGSSLGGYYATCLAEQWQCRAALLNPVVHAARDLATQVGEHTLYHGGGAFNFLPEYIDELADMAVERPAHPERYFLLAATGDEVLDWREMTDWFRGCRQHVIDGSDHGISDFATYLPETLEFALAHA